MSSVGLSVTMCIVALGVGAQSVTVLRLYLGQCSVLSVSLSCPTACSVAFVGLIKMNGWMDGVRFGHSRSSKVIDFDTNRNFESK